MLQCAERAVRLVDRDGAMSVVVGLALAAAAEPCRHRELPDPVSPDQSQLGLELDRHQQHEQEAEEGHHEVHAQPDDRQRQADDQAGGEQDRTPPRDPVAALGERRVLFELLLDLAKDALLILGQRHEPIIARSARNLNAVVTLLRICRADVMRTRHSVASGR